MKISILLATYKRDKSLVQALSSFCKLEGREKLEVLIVDNAGETKTRKLVKRFKSKLPIKYYAESRRGKNIALNSIIDKANGDILVFVDDDVVVDKNWLKEIREGVNRWPQYTVFGGRILPHDQNVIPEEYRKFKSYPYLFGVADWDISEGEYGYDKIFGPNMIVRGNIFKQGYRFDERVGPCAGNYIAGGETDLLQRLDQDGHKAVYLPKALVYHRIRPEQTQWKWILNRAFRGGRSIAWRERAEPFVRIFGIPRYVYRGYGQMIRHCLRSMLFNRGELKEGQYNIRKYHGIFYQYWYKRAEMKVDQGLKDAGVLDGQVAETTGKRHYSGV